MGLLSWCPTIKSSHWNSFENRAPVDCIYKWVTETCGKRWHAKTSSWAPCQICNTVPGMSGTFSPRVSDPDMHHGTCVTHAPWCMSGSLTSSSLRSRWRGKRSRHSRCMCNPQFYVSGKRPMGIWWNECLLVHLISISGCTERRAGDFSGARLKQDIILLRKLTQVSLSCHWNSI